MITIENTISTIEKYAGIGYDAICKTCMRSETINQYCLVIGGLIAIFVILPVAIRIFSKLGIVFTFIIAIALAIFVTAGFRILQ